MHSLRAYSTVYRFRIAALLYCMNLVIRVAAIGMAVPALMLYDRKLATYALIGLILTILTTIVIWMLVTRTNCPLCMTPVLALNNCSKHGKAKTALGSHRLRVALSILFRGSFACPYCQESTAVRARNRTASRIRARR